jgi:cytidylate kinase
MRVAIDGPAGAGKSTIARLLAAKLGFLLVDTGALYRAVALAAWRSGIAWDDEARVASLAASLAAHDELKLEAQPVWRGASDDPTATPLSGSGVRLLLRGEDVSLAIRTPEVSLGASRVAAIPGVRTALLELQRAAGREHSVVLEGRDIGTVVFPDAEVKFFLTAPLEVRAERRRRELEARGRVVSMEETAREVEERDRADSEREVAPLRKAHDAVLVDSGGRTVAELVDHLAGIVRARAGTAP